MSTPFPPVPPLPADDDAESVPTRDVDGERVLDPDIDDASIDSAEADRLAAGAGDPDDDTTT